MSTQRLGFHKLTDHTVRFESLHHGNGQPTEYIARIDTDKTDHNGRGSTPAEALFFAASRWYHHEQLEKEAAEAEVCPKCNTGKLMSQRGGGVACNASGCTYWFCY